MKLEAPFTEKKIRALKVGDRVEISGLVYTGRDAVHKYLHDGGKRSVDLKVIIEQIREQVQNIE